jgi:hypothetical protein
VTLNGVTSLRNGSDDDDGDGVHIKTKPTALVTIKGSAFMGNYGSGIYLAYRGSNWLTPIIQTTSYSCNDVDKDGNANLVKKNVAL